MFGRNFRKEAPPQRSDPSRQHLHEASPVGQAHHTKPKRHHANQLERDLNSFFGALDSLLGNIVDMVREASKEHRTHDEPEPDVIEHPLWLRHLRRHFEQFRSMAELKGRGEWVISGARTRANRPYPPA